MELRRKRATRHRKAGAGTPGAVSSGRRASIKRALKGALARRPEIVFAYLFGSFAEKLPFRDIDIAVWVDEDAGRKDLEQDPWRYEAKLGAGLTPLVGIPVDVTVLNHAPLPLRYHATRGELLFTRDEMQRCTFLEETWRDYFEMEPHLRQFLHDILEA
ncbi:MAG: nucleotidyltransferase domain-containing protein [Firmicutes bacterium]|nr:nucleotidyltransferase domain-containing protein [Bacillota bacterium]